MAAIITMIAGFLGISSARLIAYAVVTVAIVIAGLTIRQHYINEGWDKAMARVQKQDDAAVAAARKVEKRVTVCSEANGYWDVVTQGCKLEDAE